MAKTTILAPPPPPIEPIKLKDALEERYLAYALSTIMTARCPTCATASSPCIGASSTPCASWGSIPTAPTRNAPRSSASDGQATTRTATRRSTTRWCASPRTSPSATRWSTARATSATSTAITPPPIRYTEARLSPTATALLDGIDEDTVDFRPTYNGRGQEPVVLPANFPNLLANGSSGIAVGMATSIPPHNAEELCTRCPASHQAPRTPPSTKLVEFVPGPDFPTGGIIVEPREPSSRPTRPAAAASACAPGGRRRTPGRGTYQIVVTEIPYQVQKAKLVERIAELIDDKKAAAAGRRARRDRPRPCAWCWSPRAAPSIPMVLMESLFKLTELEIRFSLNMNVLSGGQIPRRLSLRDAAEALAGAPPGRAGAALAVPPEEDRAPPARCSTAT